MNYSTFSSSSYIFSVLLFYSFCSKSFKVFVYIFLSLFLKNDVIKSSPAKYILSACIRKSLSVFYIVNYFSEFSFAILLSECCD